VLAIGGTYRDAAGKLSLAVGIARLNADGSYDPSFGNGGWNKIEYGPAHGNYALEIAARLVPRSGGGWLIGATGHKAWALSAWTANGQPDTSWNGGRLDFNADGSKAGEMFGDMVALPNGSLIAGGSSLYRLLLSRFKANGALDRSFGRKGRRIIEMAELGMTDIRGISALLPQSGGKLVVLASGRKTPQSEKETLVLLRLRNNGAQDRRFGR
jgi:uncharacterized delta-60 repeat protein